MKSVAAAASSASNRNLWRWAVGALAVGVLLWLLGPVLLLVFAAVLLAVALRGGSEGISELSGWPPRVCLGLLVLGVVLVLAAAGILSGARLAEQGNQLWDQLVQTAWQTREWLRQFSWGRAVVAGASPGESAEQGQRLASGVGLALMTVVGALASVVIAVVAALYFAASPQFYIDGLMRLLPQHRRVRGRAVIAESGHTLRQWLLGQGISMLLVAVVSYIGLVLLGVPMAFLLALIAGLTNFVPYVGPIVGAAPAVLVALGADVETALWVALLFGAIQVVEGNLVQPLVQKRMTHLPPALTILSQTVFGTLFGVIGVILATPVLAVILVAVRMLYVEDMLGDHADADS